MIVVVMIMVVVMVVMIMVMGVMMATSLFSRRTGGLTRSQCPRWRDR